MWIGDSLRTAIERLNPFTQRQSGALPGLFSHQLALAAYMSSGMLRKVIAIPAEDRVREWRDWQADKDTITLLEAEEKRLSLIAKVKAAEILRGIGGGALLLITAGDHAQPLMPETVNEGGLLAINLVSRWQIQGQDWVANLADPLHGTPRMFKISSAGALEQSIHPSRVVCFRGPAIPAGAAVSDEDAFWGDSRLLRVFTEVQRSDDTQAWFAALVKKAKLLRVGIPNLDSMDETKIAARVSLIATGESVMNATVYRSSASADDAGEKIDDYQVTWNGIPAMMDAFDQRVAAVADIPFTRLMGRSPAGMNATGEHDSDNWNKMVVSGQKLELAPCLDQIDGALIRSAGLSPDDITWRFAPLGTPSEKEEADTFNTTMDAVTKLQNTGGIPDVAFAKGLQNLMSEREWVPGLDQALAEIPEDERFGIEPDLSAGDPNADPNNPKGGDPNASAGGSGQPGQVPPLRRAANDAWMIEDWAPKTLYVRRDVLNRDEIVKWARSQGFTDIVPDLHVTITYSTTPVDWMKMGESWRGKLEVEAGGPRLVEALGPDGKYKVLLFTAYELVSRNAEMREKGASFSWEEYQPHISIQLGGDLDLAKVEPYTGKIMLGPEIFEEIRSGDA